MEHRKKELLRILLNESRIYSYNELCKYLSISDRLLRYCIDDTNHLLKQHSLPCVKKIRGKGVILELRNGDEVKVKETILNHTYIDKENRELIILFSIINNKQKSYAHIFQKQFDVSKSAIDADMRNLRNICQEFHIKIVSTPKQGLKLFGDEWAIRLMLNNIMNTKFDILQLLKSSTSQYLTIKEKVVLDYFGETSVKSIYQIIRDSLHVSGEVDNELYCAQLTIYFAFWMKRYSQKHRLDASNSFIKSYEKRHTQKIVQQFLLKVGLLNVEDSEKNYLDFMVDSLNLQRKQSFFKEWVKYQMLSIQMIDQMSDLRGIPYASDPTLFENLFQHVCALMKRITENISIYNPLKNMIEKEYSHMFQDIKMVSNALKKEFGKVLPDEEIAYLSIHFSASEEKVRNQMKAKYRVVVVCGHGIATGELLAEKIKQKFPFDVIGIVNSYEVKAIARLDADFALKTTDTKIPYIPSIEVNPMLMTNDYEKIKQFICKHKKRFERNNVVDNRSLFDEILVTIKRNVKEIKEEQLRMELKKVLQKHEIKVVERGIQPMISELLVDEYIQLQQKVPNWQTAIKKVASPLLRNGIIQQEYIDAMIKSVDEYGPYIVIGEGIALAHAKPSDGVNELGISVMTLQAPIQFNHEDHDPVSLIFCLAAIDNQAHLKMMATIVKLINEEGKIKELSDHCTIEAFKKCLYALEK